MKKLEVENEDWGIGKGYGCITKSDDEHSTENDGFVLTNYGYVKVYSVKYKLHKTQPCTFIEMIKDGRLRVRRFNRFYSSRFLVTLAKRFAKDVFKEK